MTLSTHFTARTVAAAALIAALSGVAACSPDAPVPAPSSAAPTPSASSKAPTKIDRQAARAQKALDKLAAGKPSPTTTQLLSALTSAGFDPGHLEATRSTTPLKNDVPSVMYGIQIGKKSCLVGEVRQGVATVTVADPVEQGKRCLIGDVETPKK